MLLRIRSGAVTVLGLLVFSVCALAQQPARPAPPVQPVIPTTGYAGLDQ
jgi:hypothetical protein